MHKSTYTNSVSPDDAVDELVDDSEDLLATLSLNFLEGVISLGFSLALEVEEDVLEEDVCIGWRLVDFAGGL